MLRTVASHCLDTQNFTKVITRSLYLEGNWAKATQQLTVDLQNLDLADGGAGLICTGNIPIHRDNLENYNNAVLDINNPWDPVEAFAPAIKAAKSRGAIFLPQLQFPGRQVPEFLNPNPKSSSDQQLGPCLNKTYGKPSPLTNDDIEDLIRRYVWASEVLAKAGADGIIVCFLARLNLSMDY